MAILSSKSPSAKSLATISNVLLSAFIIGILSLARDLLVPLALAALLTFMLAPLVTRIQRWLGRTGAVLVVVCGGDRHATVTGAVARVASYVAVSLPESEDA